jgi:hypothetical protein
MRTTLSIDDDIFRIVRTLAEERRTSLGKVLSDLARRGLSSRQSYSDDSGLPLFEVSEAAPLFGPDEVANAEDDM